MDVLARIRGFPAGDGLDMDVLDGERVRLVGPNGAGKTSLLRALAGLPSAVVPRLARSAVRPDLVFQAARDGLIGLTVAGEYRMRGLHAPARSDGDQDTATLSQGEARRLALDVVEAGQPRLLLLDEPTEGLDDDGVKHLTAALDAWQGAVVFVDHMARLGALADRTVAIGGETQGGLPVLPARAGTVAEAPAGVVRRGSRAIRTPAWRAGAGLHVVRGPNGCGKSSWLLALAGLLPGVKASVDGAPPEAGRDVRLLLPGLYDHLHERRVGDAMDGLDPVVAPLVPRAIHDRHPLRLSGGEARRVALAKTLGRPARLYLLDEPEAHLDAAGRAALWEVLRARIEDGACVLAASHDPGVQAAAASVLEWDA